MSKETVDSNGRKAVGTRALLCTFLLLLSVSVSVQATTETANSAAAERVFAQLVSHLPASDAEIPTFLKSDLREIANYLSRYPKAVALVERVGAMNWQMRYRPGRWVTAVSATQLSVKSVTVYVDTRMAVRVFARRACMQEPLRCARVPAEALLHELLHVEEIRGEPMQYLAERSVGLDSVQSAHESRVIAEETRLAVAMSEVDGVRRPRRTLHTGSLYAVACATCIDDSLSVGSVAQTSTP